MVDFAPSVALPFRGPNWLQRNLVGALLELLPALVAIPLALRAARHGLPWPGTIPSALFLAATLSLACRFVVLGYLRRVAKGVLEGTLDELPAWDQLGTDFVEGFKLWLTAVGLFVPAVGLVAAGVFLVVAAAGSSSAWIPVAILAPPLVLTTLFFLPVSLLAAVARDDVAAAFDVAANARRLGTGMGAYLLAFLVALMAEIVAQLGLLLCCVGIVLTRFVAHCVVVHAFATAYRAAAPQESEQPS